MENSSKSIPTSKNGKKNYSVITIDLKTIIDFSIIDLLLVHTYIILIILHHN